MTRVPYVDLQSPPAGLADVLERTQKRFGHIPNFLLTMGHSPEAVRSWQAGEEVRLKNLGANPEFLRVQQMVIMKTASLNGPAGEYCLTHNVKLSREIGVTNDEIEAVTGDYATSTLLNAREKAATRWAEAVTRLEAQSDNLAFAEMQKHFTTVEIVELTVLSCMWNFSNRFCGALHLEIEPEDEQISFYPKSA